MSTATQTKRSVIHATFSIEHIYDFPPVAVFTAFANPDAEAQWFRAPDDWRSSTFALNFRVGGREVESTGGPKGGPTHVFEARYQDIVPNERIIYTYHMHLDDKRISVSVATIEFTPTGQCGTHLVMTEQGAYLDGRDVPAKREEGPRHLLDALDNALQRAAEA